MSKASSHVRDRVAQMAFLSCFWDDSIVPAAMVEVLNLLVLPAIPTGSLLLEVAAAELGCSTVQHMSALSACLSLLEDTVRAAAQQCNDVALAGHQAATRFLLAIAAARPARAL